MSRSEKSPLVPVLLVCFVIGAGIVAYIKLAPADTVVREVQNEQQTGGEGVHLLTPYYTDDNELKFRSEPVEVPKDVDPHVFVINRYLRTVTFVPKDAELKTCTIENGTATLDFNSAFFTSYGTADESTVINGILVAMGQFKEVSYVRIIVDGKPIDTLGNLELTDPLPVTRTPGMESGAPVPGPASS